MDRLQLGPRRTVPLPHVGEGAQRDRATVEHRAVPVRVVRHAVVAPRGWPGQAEVVLPIGAVPLPGVAERDRLAGIGSLTAEQHDGLLLFVEDHRAAPARRRAAVGDLRPGLAVPRPQIGVAVRVAVAATEQQRDSARLVEGQRRTVSRRRAADAEQEPVEAVPLPGLQPGRLVAEHTDHLAAQRIVAELERVERRRHGQSALHPGHAVPGPRLVAAGAGHQHRLAVRGEVGDLAAARSRRHHRLPLHPGRRLRARGRGRDQGDESVIQTAASGAWHGSSKPATVAPASRPNYPRSSPPIVPACSRTLPRYLPSSSAPSVRSSAASVTVKFRLFLPAGRRSPR